ncbi:MAG: hypothetical protein ACRDRZ_00365 [Pseudonocardiaceae bacterium]
MLDTSVAVDHLRDCAPATALLRDLIGSAEPVVASERAYEAKYGNDWHFDVGDGVFGSGDDAAAVFRIEPVKVLAFAKGPHAQTTHRFTTR